MPSPPSCAALLCAALILTAGARSGQGAVSRAEYLAYMQGAADSSWASLESDREQWRKTIDTAYVFGYNPPGNEVYLAALSVSLFEATGDSSGLRRAKRLLLEFGRHREAYPRSYGKNRAEYAAGLPALPNIFYMGKYCHAYAILKKHMRLTDAERRTIDDNIAGSADFVANFQEWGAMNRAMLRAEALLYAAKVVTDHPRRQHWITMGEAIAGDNWDQWEIEDATSYNGVWLYSLLAYVSDIRADERLYRSPIMSYYFEYFLQMISPAGFVPDVGDANWGSSWERMVPFFEKGAAVTGDPRLRWAAAQNFRKFLDPLPKAKSVFTAVTMADALRWADFSLPAEPPVNGSREVLEDLVGKKVVFRNGWTPSSAYLLLNYRDEGDGGWLFRENLRTSIPVEEEKMHHGHSDENSIALFMRNNGVLLHDGGYRNYMPSGPYGAFRADYYHNRLVVRDGKIALGQKAGEYRFATPNQEAVPGQTMLEFFRNSGAYQEVRTRKIDFLTLKDYSMSRTRLIDSRLGYEADRLVVHVKDLDWFVVVDAVRFTSPGYLTMASLWHTRQVLQQGPGWYDTAYDSLQRTSVQSNERLLVVFPARQRLQLGVETQERYYQREQVVYQMIGRHGYRNDIQAFVTVLIPHTATEDPRRLVESVEMADPGDDPSTITLSIRTGGKTYRIGAKLDMERELVRDWRRPMYTYESAKTTFGPFESDAYHLFSVEEKDRVRYAAVGAIKIVYKGKVLHEQFPVDNGLAFDGSPNQPGVWKLRYWEGETRP